MAILDDKHHVVDRDAAVKSSNGSTNSEDPTVRLHVKTFLAVFAVCMIYFAQLVSIVGAGAQGQTIAAHFEASSSTVWLSAPITILTVVLGPIYSQAADYWGRKWFLVLPTIMGGVGSIIIARAHSIGMVIAGCTVMGIAFGTQPLLHTVTSEVLPRRWRGYGQAADMASNSLGSIFGLLVGGALNRTNDPTSDGFRYYYYITMAIYVFAAVLCVLVYHPPPTDRQSLPIREKLAKLDWIGYLLLATGLVLFCVGLSFYKSPYEFGHPTVAGIFGAGLGVAVCLVVYESLFKKDGMFHHGLFTGNRNFSVSLICVFAEGVAFFAANTYFAFQISVLYEKDSILVGARYSIMLISSAFAAMVTGWYCARFRKVRWVTVLAFAIFVAFFACMANTDTTTNTPTWGYTVLLGFGLGMTLTTLVTVAQLSTPVELISMASGLIISIRSLGGTIGIAIYNAIFNGDMSYASDNMATAVVNAGLAPQYAADLIGAFMANDSEAMMAIPGVTTEIIDACSGALLGTYARAFDHVWIAASCFVAAATIVATFLFDPQQEFTMSIDATVEKESNPASENSA